MENFFKTQQNSLKSLFQRNKSPRATNDDDDDPSYISPRPIPQLSPLANSVVFHCSKILKVPTQELQHQFDIELPETVKQLFTYARNFVEFCSYQALHEFMKRPDYMSETEFRRLMFDMMLAWEAPSVESESDNKETVSKSKEEVEEGDGWSLFYSSTTNMAVQVDDNKTVGREAFARIAPVCAAVADIITVHNLFDALTSASDNRLHFLIYDKYVRSLDKIVKAAKNVSESSVSSLQLAEGEIIIDIDGSVPVQPVLKHIGISAWPGKLTLTNYALYFESLGVGVYEKPIIYDLATDMKQVIKPELTGPLGARLFDKAVMYKSKSVVEPVYFEFTEFKGNARRDYWLGICLEILRTHRFIKKHNLKETQKSEALAKAILGIYRYRAVREAVRVFSSHYKTLLTFNLAESLPGGDAILETLSNRLALINASGSPYAAAQNQYVKWPRRLSPVSVLTLKHFGLNLQRETNLDVEGMVIGDFCVGETSPLEIAVKQSLLDTGKAEAAQATVDQVKVEGIDTNVAVMKELLLPIIGLGSRLQHLATWDDPLKSSVFVFLSSIAIIRGWIRYILPLIFIFFALLMLWRKHFNRGKPLEAFKIRPPPNKNPVEQLLTLQDAISQAESLIQAGNVSLLKIRAILFAVLPQATDRTAIFLIFLACAIAFLPVRCLMLMVFLEIFTREFPFRRESSRRYVRRVKEWWFRIPAAPVQLVKDEDSKKKK